MDKVKLNNAIGFGLIFLILMVWMQFNKPSKEQLELDKRQKDSIELSEKAQVKSSQITAGNDTVLANKSTVTDSASLQRLSVALGSFAASGTGKNEMITLENDLMKVSFNSKGGSISKVELKKYFKIVKDTATKKEVKQTLYLLEDPKNIFSYNLPIADAVNKTVKTSELYFQPTVTGKKIVFRASAGDDKYVEQIYELKEGSYGLQYQFNTQGLGSIWDPGKKNFVCQR